MPLGQPSSEPSFSQPTQHSLRADSGRIPTTSMHFDGAGHSPEAPHAPPVIADRSGVLACAGAVAGGVVAGVVGGGDDA